MGTAIEMWEAHQHGATILTISPMKHNWTVKFLSHGLYADEAEFVAALRAGEVARTIESARASGSGPHPSLLPEGEGTTAP